MALRIFGTKGNVQAPKATSHHQVKYENIFILQATSLFEWTCLDGPTQLMNTVHPGSKHTFVDWISFFLER